MWHKVGNCAIIGLIYSERRFQMKGRLLLILLLGVTMMFLFGCGKNLEKLAGSGNWQAGRRFKGGASENEVSKWLGTLE